MTPDFPLSRDLVLVGGGHTHALVLKMWAMSPLPGARVTVINPAPAAPYSGMLPGFIAGHYSSDGLYIDLMRLARAAGVTFIEDKATHIDPAAKLVHLAGRDPLPYDVLSVDVGITSDMPDLPGFADHAVPAKPLDDFAASWEAYCNQEGPAQIAVLGAGVAGSEVAMAAAHRMAQLSKSADIHLIDRSGALSRLGPSARRTCLSALDTLGVTLHEHTQITSLTEKTIHLANGSHVTASFILGAAGTRPYPWLSASGLDHHDGYISVGPTLQSTSHPDLFACGDCAHLTHASRPKAGVFAVRQAPILAQNLKIALAEQGEMTRYQPQKDYLKLVSLGGKSALAEKLGIKLSGRLMWRWKDRIDQTFMRQFEELTPMQLEPPRFHAAADGTSETMLCAGCGSKVGRGTLTASVDGLIGADRADVMRLPGDDAAQLTIGGTTQVLTTDHLRAFTDDAGLMAEIATVHALGDIWSMGAAPQSALLSITLPRMSKALQERTLRQIMRSASRVLEREGAAIIGGHTTMGAEMVIGLSLTGLIPNAPKTLADAQPGDVIILSKAIGTGTILAADMQLKAKGHWTSAALALMARPSGDVAAVLREAHAMTDVTGFGLAGHLANICRASGVDAELDVGAVPLLEGALDLAKQGVRSSLYPDNLSDLLTLTDAPTTARGALMLDPQTSGGMLATISPEAWARVDAARQGALHVIGRVTGTAAPSGPRLSLIDQ